MLATVEPVLDTLKFGIALAFVGGGIGLLASQLGNVIQSSVDARARGEAGGLQYTATNLGSSLGTALIGAILLTGLLTSTQNYVADNPAITDEVKEEFGVAIQGGVPFIPSSDVQDQLTAAGVPSDEVDAIVESYEQSQVDALRVSFAALAILTVIGFWFTRKLPTERLGEGEVDEETVPAL
jgi:hypothetical protein